jgi:amino acid adenylation domain-containing protein/non-ribosomal peptide synthase protein (TIGR01720 family)
VGICVERSVEMVVGLLGILKAGAAYVPLDTQYPEERLRFMLADAQVGVLLTQEQLLARLPEHEAQVVCLDRDWKGIGQQSEQNPESAATADNLAYMIYTSGSTGRPKGVQIQHSSLVNLVHWHQHLYEVTAADRATQLAGIAFDACVWELWPYLTAGASIHLPDEQTHASLPALLRWMGSEAITLSFFPTPLAEAALAEQWPRTMALRALLTGGDKLNRRPGEKLGFRLINHYGPTESTVVATSAAVSVESKTGAVPAIGRPIANTEVYVLDQRGQMTPVGVAGELHIGGAGLARGYWQRAELTAERFIPDPFSLAPGKRLYRTGDLVRYLADGNIEYLGRLDQQVKVRGHRIELGEIEVVLGQHERVRQSVVVAREDAPGQKQLVAYVVNEGEPAVSAGELRSYLGEQLPEYMVPAFFVTLAELPLTPNGKVDRRALPAPEHSRTQSDQSYVAAITPAEQALAAIWCEVLGLPQVGVHDNFFHLGGDSILSIQVVSKARQAGFQLTPKQLFQHPTIAQLAVVVGTTMLAPAEQGQVSGAVPLIPIQHWFFEQELAQPEHFNQALLLESQGLDAALLQTAIGHLLAHHDGLRLRFRRAEAGWEQFNQESIAETLLSLIDLRELREEEVAERLEAEATQLQASLNLEAGPLLRVALFELGVGERLLIVIHHLVVDGVSWRILLEDLQTAYQQLSRGEAVKLPAKTTSFKRWAELLSEYAESESVGQELSYWSGEGGRRVKELPVDYEGGSNSNASAGSVTVRLSEEETRILLQEVPEVYHTEINDVLLTALVQAYGKWSGERMLLVDLEGHGREELGEEVDVSRTVGWFTTMYPVRLEIKAGSNVGVALKEIKEQLRGIPQRGLGYGLLRYMRGAEAQEQLRGARAAQVSFNYLGQVDQLFTERAAWAVARESSGRAHATSGLRAHLLDVSGIIGGGSLQITWVYSEAEHRRGTIEGLAQRYLEALQELIAHCQLAEAGGFTPSDFPLAKLDETELDNVLQTVEF